MREPRTVGTSNKIPTFFFFLLLLFWGVGGRNGFLAMVKDIKAKNETIKPNDKVLEKLHLNFPECFNKEGIFDIEKFQQLIKNEVDVTQEGYDLNFLGKNYANLIACTETETVIQPDIEHNSLPQNAKSQNIYISGDNLDALKHLLKSYSGKVKCIYIDPPYNTGSDGFVYNDRFNFTAIQLQTKLGVTEEKANRILNLCKRGSASHSAWLMFMAPRLMLARDLLTEDGVIFISIDDNEQANLRLLCDSVFGEENFVGNFIWRKKNGGGQAKDAFVIEHEYIIVYSKTKEKDWIESKEKRNEKEFNKNDENGNFRISKLAKWGNTAHREERPTMYFPITAPDGSDVYPIAPDGTDGRWIVGKSTMQELIKNNLIHWIEKDGIWIPYEKEYYSEQDKIIKERSILYDVANTGDGSDMLTDLFGVKDTFENPKPIDLIKIFLSHTMKNGDVFLDFFSGSGTSAHALYDFEVEKDIKCRFIQVQLEEKCKEGKPAYNLGYKTIDIFGIERIQRAARKIRKDLEKEISTKQDQLAIKEKKLLTENQQQRMFDDIETALAQEIETLKTVIEKKQAILKNIDLGFKHYILQDVSKNTLDKMETFDPNCLYADDDILHKFGEETILATWLVKDGYGFGETIPLHLANYTAYYCKNHIYLIGGKDFDENAMIALVDKYGRESDFNPENVVLFGYSFTYTQVEMLRKNLAAVKKLENNINLDIRY